MNRNKNNFTDFSFDDILLKPRKTIVTSRTEVDLTTNFCGFSLTSPFINSPMDTVASLPLGVSMLSHGAAFVTHRFQPIQQQAAQLRELRQQFPHGALFCSIGLQYTVKDIAKLLNAGAARGVLIDTAQGWNVQVERLILDKLRFFLDAGISIIAGNIVGADGAEFLCNLGVDALRVGIGNGSVCTTRIKTGFGRGQLSALSEISEYLKTSQKDSTYVIADGGIRTSGDCVKAIAVGGADIIMLGRLLSQTFEANSIDSRLGVYSGTYAGMARGEYTEGETVQVQVDRTVTDVLVELERGIQSGVSYAGYQNLSDLREFGSEYYIVSGTVLEEGKVRR